MDDSRAGSPAPLGIRSAPFCQRPPWALCASAEHPSRGLGPSRATPRTQLSPGHTLLRGLGTGSAPQAYLPRLLLPPRPSASVRLISLFGPFLDAEAVAAQDELESRPEASQPGGPRRGHGCPGGHAVTRQASPLRPVPAVWVPKFDPTRSHSPQGPGGSWPAPRFPSDGLGSPALDAGRVGRTEWASGPNRSKFPSRSRNPGSPRPPHRLGCPGRFTVASRAWGGHARAHSWVQACVLRQRHTDPSTCTHHQTHTHTHTHTRSLYISTPSHLTALRHTHAVSLTLRLIQLARAHARTHTHMHTHSHGLSLSL